MGIDEMDPKSISEWKADLAHERWRRKLMLKGHMATGG